MNLQNKEYLKSLANKLYENHKQHKNKDEHIFHFRDECKRLGFDWYLIGWQEKISRKINKAYE